MLERNNPGESGGEERAKRKARYDRLFALAQHEAARELVDRVLGRPVDEASEGNAVRIFTDLGTLTADLGLKPAATNRLLSDVGTLAVEMAAAEGASPDIVAALANEITSWLDTLAAAVSQGFTAADHGIPLGATRWMMHRDEFQPFIIEDLVNSWPSEVKAVTIMVGPPTRSAGATPGSASGPTPAARQSSGSGAPSSAAATEPMPLIHLDDHDVLLIGHLTVPAPRSGTKVVVPVGSPYRMYTPPIPLSDVRRGYTSVVTGYRLIELGVGKPAGPVLCPPSAWPDFPVAITREDLLLIASVLGPLAGEPLDTRLDLGRTLRWALDGQFTQQQIAHRLGFSPSTISQRGQRNARILGERLKTTQSQVLVRAALPTVIAIWEAEYDDGTRTGSRVDKPGTPCARSINPVY